MDVEKIAELKVRILEVYKDFFNDPEELTQFVTQAFKEVFRLP